MKLGENQGFIVSVSSQKMVLAHNFFFASKVVFVCACLARHFIKPIKKPHQRPGKKDGRDIAPSIIERMKIWFLIVLTVSKLNRFMRMAVSTTEVSFNK